MLRADIWKPGIPAQHLVIEAKVTFKDGGAYDFHTKFVQIKERLKQARDVAAESGETTVSGTATAFGILDD